MIFNRLIHSFTENQTIQKQFKLYWTSIFSRDLPEFSEATPFLDYSGGVPWCLIWVRGETVCFTQYPDGRGTILFNILGILAGRMAHLPRGPKSDRLWICRNLADQHPSTFQSRYFERWLCQRVGELGHVNYRPLDRRIKMFSSPWSTSKTREQTVFDPMIDLQSTGP